MPVRPARAGQRGIATNEIGIVSVILLILGLVFARGCIAKTDASLECVTSTASPGVQGKTCPVSKAASVFPVCADPDRHLRFPPRFEGPGRLRQDLPAGPGTPTLEVGRTTSYVAARQSGSVTILDVKPRIWWRYFGGPVVQILCLFYVVALFFQFNPKDRPPPGIIVMTTIAALLSGFLLWKMADVEGSHAFQIDPAGKRVVHHRYLFGWERTPRIYETEFAPVFVRTRTGWTETCSLVLIAREGGKPRAIELIDGLEEEDAVLGSWLRARLP